MSGQIVISPDATTSVGLIGFGYNDAGSTAGSGLIIGGGGIIVSPLGSLTGSFDDFPTFDGEGGG